MAGRIGGHVRWAARYSIRHKKGGWDGMVTALPYECMLVNPLRPGGLVHSGYTRGHFVHSVDGYGYNAMSA